MHGGPFLRACVSLSPASRLPPLSLTPTHPHTPLFQLIWDNQLPPSMKPFHMGDIVFKTIDFGLGLGIQNKYVPAMSPLGEAGWGGAASTNWWASPSTDTVIVAMTQVAPFFNGFAETVRPVVYTSLVDWTPPTTRAAERADGTPLTEPSEEEAAKVGIGPIVEAEAAIVVEVAPDGATAPVRRGSLRYKKP